MCNTQFRNNRKRNKGSFLKADNDALLEIIIIFLHSQDACLRFQIFLLVRHLTNIARHSLLMDNTLKKITQHVLVRCSVIVSNHNVKLAGHFPSLVGQCLMTNCYFQHC